MLVLSIIINGFDCCIAFTVLLRFYQWYFPIKDASYQQTPFLQKKSSVEYTRPFTPAIFLARVDLPDPGTPLINTKTLVYFSSGYMVKQYKRLRLNYLIQEKQKKQQQQKNYQEQQMKGNRKAKKQNQSDQKLSRSMSWLLRHGAIQEGIKMGKDGFITMDDLLAYLKKKGYKQITVEDIGKIVDNNDKKRFQIAEMNHRLCIRATQGHSIKQVTSEELLTEIKDPYQYPVVIHGTFMKFWGSIKNQGLKRMTRNHIHFAPGKLHDKEVVSGMRKSCDVIIYIDLFAAMKEGIKFYLSSNNVILTEGQNGVLKPQFFKRVQNKNGDVIYEKKQEI